MPSLHDGTRGSRAERQLSEPLLEASGLSKSLAGRRILDDICLRVHGGEVLALLGPSGSGKSTLLQILAGLLPSDSGSGSLGALPIGSRQARLATGVAFQDFALFPHLDAVDNVAYPLRRRGMGRRAARTKATEILKDLGLGVRMSAKPDRLSGGERQRVAIARTLVYEPRLVLLDEPFSSLDQELATRVGREIIELSRDHQRAVVLVTHDPILALGTADSVAVLVNGQIQQTDSTQAVWRRPASLTAARLLGQAFGLRGWLRKDAVPGQAADVIVAGTTVRATPAVPLRVGEVVVIVRPGDLCVVGACAPGAVEVQVVSTTFCGSVVDLECSMSDGQRISVHAPPDEGLALGGQQIWVAWKPSAATMTSRS